MKRKSLCSDRLGKFPRVLVIGLGLVVPGPRAESSQVLALGYNMGVAPEITNGVAVSVIGYSLAVLRVDGSVAQWGNGASDPGIGNLVSIATGWSHGLGFRADGSIVGWGVDCGGSISGTPADLTNAVALGVGSCDSLAVRADGSVVGWGKPSSRLLEVPEGLSNVVALSIGAFGENALALRADGTVWEWGGGFTNTHPEISNAVAVAAANAYRGAVLHHDGHVTAWPNDPPDDVPPVSLTNIIAVAGGGSHLLALRNDGTVIAWGCDCHDSTTLPPNLTNVTAIAAGGGDGYDYSIFLIGYTNPPPVLNLTQTNGALRLTLAGERFRRYVLEESAGVNSPAAWTFNQNVALAATAQTTLQLPSADNARFYRARLMP